MSIKEKLDLNVIETDDAIITVYDGEYTNHSFGLTTYSNDRIGFCIEFLIKQKANPKKRLTRKFLDAVMEDNAVREAMHNKIFNYIRHNKKIESHYDFEYCWSNVYSAISGNRLVVAFSYKSEEELRRICNVFSNNKRWCFC